MNPLKELSSTDYGLIGFPLEHSFSKKFFTGLFATRGQDKSYDNFPLPELSAEALYSLVLLNPRLKGFNVTAPYKEAVMQYLDSIDPVAEEAGAVNTVRIVRDSGGRVLRLEGFNTDVEGFGESIRPLLSGFSKGTGAIVLGTGGASKAAVTALRQSGFSPVRVSRSKEDAGTVTYGSLDAAFMASHPIVVNATPLGTYPHTDGCAPLPFGLLAPGSVCFDMVYNPAHTEFMKRAEAAGARTANGLDMLHRQALASLRIWEAAETDGKQEV